MNRPHLQMWKLEATITATRRALGRPEEAMRHAEASTKSSKRKHRHTGDAWEAMMRHR
jgi:hypothetical protein